MTAWVLVPITVIMATSAAVVLMPGYYLGGTSHVVGSDHFTGHDQTATHSPSSSHHDNNQSGDARDDHHSRRNAHLQNDHVPNIVAAVAFFGIAGKAALASNISATTALVIAIGAAFVAADYIVYYLARSLHRFNADGTGQVGRAVGQAGTVYDMISLRRNSGRKNPHELAKPHRRVQAMTTAGGSPTELRLGSSPCSGPIPWPLPAH